LNTVLRAHALPLHHAIFTNNCFYFDHAFCFLFRPLFLSFFLSLFIKPDLGFGVFAFSLINIYYITVFGTRNKWTGKDELSAYSVFNKGHVKMVGDISAGSANENNNYDLLDRAFGRGKENSYKKDDGEGIGAFKDVGHRLGQSSSSFVLSSSSGKSAAEQDDYTKKVASAKEQLIQRRTAGAAAAEKRRLQEES
jgi:hypothetical protein